MFRQRLIFTVGFLVILGWLGMAAVATPAAPGKEKNPSAQTEPVAPGTIKSEANMVLVDAVVTDKRKNYQKDLTQKDFHVFEDGKEQPITSFSREVDIQPGAPSRQQYIVIFFDNAGLDPGGQMWERDAALKFVEKTASPTRKMAVIDYMGSLQVVQNFTSDIDLLRLAVRKVGVASGQANRGSTGFSGSERKQADLALRNLLLRIRDVAKMLGTVPGRKTMLYFSAGFNLTSARQTDFQDTIDALNQANVGVYPVGPSDLIVPTATASQGVAESSPESKRSNIRPLPEAVRTMPEGGEAKSALYALAARTGGFPIITVGMEKVSEEMNQYYLLGYVPPNQSHNGSYHKIKVKVDRPGVEVRARSGYADTRSPDLLAGKNEGVALEAKVTSFEAGEIPVTLSTPYFYIRPGMARVNLALSIPANAVDFQRHGDNYRAQMNVLGIAYRDDGSVATRFSDVANLDYDKDEMRELTKANIEYQNSFKLAPGEYTFKLVLSTEGGKFGKYVVPLALDPFSGKQFTLSGPAFGGSFISSPMSSADIDQSLIEGSAPMVANDMQAVPSSNNRFKKDAQPVVYVEVYDPILESSNPQIGILFDIVDRKTNQKVYSSNTISLHENIHPGNPLVPAIFKLPMDKLPPGDYRIEIQGRDSPGNTSPVRTGDFSVE
jgi:VWFA-related protein